MNFDTESISVGDKVICYSGGMGHEKIGIVDKKTPSGLIDVNFGNYKKRFRKDGSEQKGSLWHHNWLGYYSEEKQKQIEEAREVKEIVYKISECKFADFGLEALKLIWEICEKEIEKN